MHQPLSLTHGFSSLLAAQVGASSDNSTTSCVSRHFPTTNDIRSVSDKYIQCTALQSVGISVLYPGNELYENRTESYWSITSQLTPWCIVSFLFPHDTSGLSIRPLKLIPCLQAQPISAEQVSLAVTTLVDSTPCQFAVRSGGHFIWPANNSEYSYTHIPSLQDTNTEIVEEGVTIDLGLMNTTTYDEESKIASILPGSRWRGVYETLDPHNVTVSGGRAASVGVTGFLTGGGNSFYSARKGFACDSVVNFEVVLASGYVADRSGFC